MTRLTDGFPPVQSIRYVHDGTVPIVFGLGIHGQYLLVHRKHGIVIAKVASQALPIDTEAAQLTTRAISRIVQFLAPSSG